MELTILPTIDLTSLSVDELIILKDYIDDEIKIREIITLIKRIKVNEINT